MTGYNTMNDQVRDILTETLKTAIRWLLIFVFVTMYLFGLAFMAKHKVVPLLQVYQYQSGVSETEHSTEDIDEIIRDIDTLLDRIRSNGSDEE